MLPGRGALCRRIARAANPDLIRRKTVHDSKAMRLAGFDDVTKTEGGRPKELIGTAYFAHSARLVAAMRRSWGKSLKRRPTPSWPEAVRAAFQQRFYPRRRPDRAHPDRRRPGVHFDWCPPSDGPASPPISSKTLNAALETLDRFVGSSYLPHVLAATGHLDVAFRLLHQKSARRGCIP